LGDIPFSGAGDGEIGEDTLRVGVGGEQDAETIQHLRSRMIARVFLRMKFEDAAVGRIGDDRAVPPILRECVEASATTLL
jgi:hypothetical protein